MIDFIKENWSYICTGLFGLVVVASVIVGMTPSTKDDGFMSKLVSFLDHFSVAKKPRDKQLIAIAEDVLNNEKKEN